VAGTTGRTQLAGRIPTVGQHDLRAIAHGLVLELAPQRVKADIGDRARQARLASIPL
jgi:hypothetical protein